MGPRRQQRIEYIVPAEIEIEGEITHGQIVDWTNDGVQVLSVIPIEDEKSYHINYYLERHRFDENTELNEETWQGTGKTMWAHPYKDGSWVGIKFDDPIELSMEGIKDFFTLEDYFFISFSSEEQPLHEEGHQEPIYHDSLEPNKGNWIMWGTLILIQIIILFVLLRESDSFSFF